MPNEIPSSIQIYRFIAKTFALQVNSKLDKYGTWSWSIMITPAS